MENKKIISRKEQKQEDCWRLEDLYESAESWEIAAGKLSEMFQNCKNFAGSLQESPDRLLEALRYIDETEKLFERVYVYAMQSYHQDTGDDSFQKMSGKASALAVQLSEATSFVEPELLEVPEETLHSWLKEKEELEVYTRHIEEILRVKPHICSKEIEALLASAGELGSAPQDIFMAFNNADLTFDPVTDEKGQEQPLTHGRYIGYMENADRRVRKEAFEKYYASYEKMKNTLSASYTANLKQNAFFASARHYDNTLQAALDGGNIPVEVYHQLIATVRKHLPKMYRYVSLRKKLLGLDELHMYDVYVPTVQAPEKKYSFEEAKKMVKQGLSVLGQEYMDILEEGFSDRWIDVYENAGKRSGAYSWGAYGVHPYVLLNFSGSLDSVFTLAHEMGHAIQSYYSDRTQPYVYAGYRIFVAEVASTCNEALLIRSLLDQAETKEEKAYLINHFLDQFKGTLFRQTMFAEFEWKTHDLLAKEGSLSCQSLCDIYHRLNSDYFGPEMINDSQIAMEWARIPHFYTPFYVYQYATGFSAAIAISSKILKGEEGILERYKSFLSGGSSMDPIDLLKLCGVDMTGPEPVEEAMEVFESFLKELEDII